MSSEVKMDKARIFGVIGIIVALLGIVSIALGWISADATFLGSSSSESWSGLDIFSWETDEFQQYIPVIIAVLSALSLIMFAVGMVKPKSKIGYGSAVLGIIVIILAVVEYMWITGDISDVIPSFDLGSLAKLSVNVGAGLYLAIASGVLTLIFGVLSEKA
ncbi:hypothetical protein [Candidatus Methanomassiliicoccus intestinalis]|uniref:hypothetical protein n=1 Tax=Candidatus Methanomassiliicoccus intestinalis TaxID=1406512 RepID=UPI0037DCF60D